MDNDREGRERKGSKSIHAFMHRGDGDRERDRALCLKFTPLPFQSFLFFFFDKQNGG